ncbi:hypothetical protein EGY31_15110 [Burkholderia multivorans]|uniref:amidohydrolase family protein n=1 Tax=Burkholderia ubonensis TaxID=101571 RepID=UPI000F6FB7C5|nr:amidohydrolase family protein [Burkholderia ubonensis]AYZ64671.1 hypothetical protein EGY31_15110 [Burkholderia multivorans]VWB42401.1 amidohydrolase family protein [Burkholderia ubonensis]
MLTLGHCPASWALKGITYFDHETRRFEVGDIEIDGQWITSVGAPGSSKIEYAIDGRDYACTPGLILAQTDLPTIQRGSERLLRAGVTTAGATCRTASECILTASQTQVQLVLRLVLNSPGREWNGEEILDGRDARIFSRIASLAKLNRVRVAPAIHCSSVLSASELVYAQKFAAAIGQGLCVVLSESPEAAQAFRERFFCSEIQLLSFLRLIEPGTTVSGLSQVTPRDLDTLRRSGADVVGLQDAMRMHRRRKRLPASTCSGARREPFSQRKPEMRLGDGSFATDLTTAGPFIESALVDADAGVDDATIRAAATLGVSQYCGRIAPGMQADLCLFDLHDLERQGPCSAAFLQLFEHREPRFVFVAGQLATGASSTISDRASWEIPQRSNEIAHLA